MDVLFSYKDEREREKERKGASEKGRKEWIEETEGDGGKVLKKKKMCEVHSVVTALQM